MTETLRFLFGTGWWTALYLASYFWYFVFPGLMVTGTFKEFWRVASTGGTAGQGANGLGMVLPFLFFPIVVGPVLLVSSSLFVYQQNYLMWQKVAFVFAVSVIIPLCVGAVGFYMANRFFYFVYFGSFFALFAGHLYMLKNR